MSSRRPTGSDGYALVAVVVVIGVLLTVAAATIQMTRTELHSSANEVVHQQAFYIADAGVQRGLAQLNWEREQASNSTSYSYNGASESFGNGSYVVSIAQDSQFPSDPKRKLITSTGTKNNQTAQVVAHAVVNGSTNPPDPTVTVAPQTTPTPPGVPTPTPPGAPPPTTSATALATQTAGPAPTFTPPGVPTWLPTPTATPSTAHFPPCANHEILASYNGTAKIIDDVSALSHLISGGGRILSNNDVTFENDIAYGLGNGGATCTGGGAIYARGNFNNTGTGLSLFSKFSNVSLSLGGTYNAAAGDSLTHVLIPSCSIGACFGAHFGSAKPWHGSPATMSAFRQWQPDWADYKRSANVIVNKRYQPFGSWDSATNTWVVGGYSFPAGTKDLYYVEGNVKFSGVSLFRTAAPRIVARGWISLTTLTVLSTGLTAGDNQSIFLIAKDDVMIGRDVISMSVPTFTSESVALTAGLGLSLVNVDHTLNVIAYSERGDVWAMTSTLNANSHPRMCLLGHDDATLAFTGTVGVDVLPVN